MERINVTLSTDGACSGNPGPGGYAARLTFGNMWREISGYHPSTTNNRMEITACIEGVKVLKKPCTVTVRTDSQVLINLIANLDTRAKNGWRTKTGARVANDDLHKELYELKQNGDHIIRYETVKGHSGDPDNERCDQLAKEAILTKKGYSESGHN